MSDFDEVLKAKQIMDEMECAIFKIEGHAVIKKGQSIKVNNCIFEVVQDSEIKDGVNQVVVKEKRKLTRLERIGS